MEVFKSQAGGNTEKGRKREKTGWRKWRCLSHRQGETQTKEEDGRKLDGEIRRV